MSEDTGAEHPAHHHHEEEIEKIETISSTTTPWGVRLGFGIAGLVLLAGAFIAWEFRGSLPGHMAESLPWIIAGAVVLGAGAIMESITTEIWMVVIAGAFALAITFLIVGRVAVYPSVGQSMFVVDRVSGETKLCTVDGCKALQNVAEFPKPVPPPPPVTAVPMQPAAAPVEVPPPPQQAVEMPAAAAKPAATVTKTAPAAHK